MTADADARTDATDGAAGSPHEDVAPLPTHGDAASEPDREDDGPGKNGPIRVTAVPAIASNEVILELAVETDSLAHLAAGEELDADAAREVAALLDSYAAAVDN